MAPNITPVVSEDEWLEALGPLPKWQFNQRPLLVIAPHPDDETLGAGGLIASQRAQGVEITVVAVTDGEHAYPDEASAGVGTVRRAEQEMALQRLGVGISNIHRMQLPDSDVSSHEKEVVARLRPLVSKDMHIIAPWTGDFHPDHEACGRAARTVAHSVGAQLTYYFFWTWHRGTPALLEGLPLVSLGLDKESMSAKAGALSCHRSQLFRKTGEPILPESLLAPARRAFEVFLPQ